MNHQHEYYVRSYVRRGFYYRTVVLVNKQLLLFVFFPSMIKRIGLINMVWLKVSTVSFNLAYGGISMN